MYANVNDFRENNFFPVFDCILENSLKNIFQCLGQRKMKKRKNQKPLQMQTLHRKSTANHHEKTHKPTITIPPQSTAKPTANHQSYEQHRFLAQEHVRARVHREAQ